MSNDSSSGDSGSVPSDHIPSQPQPSSAVLQPTASEPGPNAHGPNAHGPNAHGGAQAQGLAVGQTSSIPKELAQLLAASIGQMHGAAPAMPGSVPAHGGTPTGRELASLAALMAGAHTVRQPLPRFRDELATLNYRQQPQYPADPPAHASAPQHGPAHAQQLALPAHDDEPMPIPSTWREKPRHDEDNAFRRQLSAAAMGLAAGLLVVIPAVLYLVGWIGPQKGAKPDTAVAAAISARRAAEAPRPAEIKTLKVRTLEPPGAYAAQDANDATADAPAPEPVPVTTASMTKLPAVAPNSHVEHVLVQARQRIDSGDVKAARDLLSAESDPAPALVFALAETYDPNMLAAWGSRGVNADVQRAKSLYARALDRGYGRAMARLDALQ